MTRARFLAVCFTLSLLLPSFVRAQQCQGGRTATAGGYCCWPAQRWDSSAQRCSGPPRCPAPLIADGATCVGPGQAVDEPAPRLPDMVRAHGTVDYGSEASGPAAIAPRAVALRALGTGWPSAGRIPPEGARNPRTETRSDATMQAWGGALFGLGYLGAVAGAIIAFSNGPPAETCHDRLGGSFLVPLVGGLIVWGVQENCTWAVYRQAGGVNWRVGNASLSGQGGWASLGVITSGLQLLGASLVLGGSFRAVEVTVYESRRTSLTIAPTLAGRYGLEATLRF